MHIILCSDNPSVARSVCDAVGAAGERWTLCESGMDLLAAVRTLAADLAILDVGTHGMGGSLLVSAVRELASDLPILVVSATDGAEIRAMTLQGVPHVVLGTAHDGELQRLVTGLAERRRPALGVNSR